MTEQTKTVEKAFVKEKSRLFNFIRRFVPSSVITSYSIHYTKLYEYLLSSVLISQDSLKTLTVGLANFISSVEINWGVIMALGTATTIPIVLIV